MRIGIIGGTGPAGQAVALRLAANGGAVLLGSRSSERAEEIATTLRETWASRSLAISGASNEDAAATDVVILATPWDAVPSTVTGLKSALAGQVVVSMVNALTRVGREFQAIIPARGSVAATVQALLPQSEVSAAFQHLPAGPLASLDDPIEADVLICADTARAFEATKALVELVPGLRGIAGGSLASANAVEALTAVLLNANRSEKAHLAIRLVALTEHAP